MTSDLSVFEKVADLFDNPWDDPVAWVTDRTQGELWSKQREILRAVRDEPRVVVKSAHSMGKSWVAARLAAWWIERYWPEGFVVTTAPTNQQVKTILWKEMRRVHSSAQLRGRMNLTEWWVGDEMVAFGRKPADWDPDAFQGIHAPRMLVVIDEAAGVPDTILEAAESLASNEKSKILAIGNPTSSASWFARACRPDSGWHAITINGLESPNFTDEGKELSLRVRESLLSPDWVERRIRQDWGSTDAPQYHVRVLGEFAPESADSTVVPWSYIERCRRFAGIRWDRNDSRDSLLAEFTAEELLPVELGVDVAASSKGDETVIRERRGKLAFRTWRMRSDKPEVVTQAILKAWKITGATAIKIDGIGWGWGVVGMVRERLRRQGVRVVGFNVAKKSTKPAKFKNLRSQLWWEVGRELSQDGGWDLSVVDDRTLAQLNAPEYTYDTAMRVVVEPKDKTKERINRSPDDADALLLAFVGMPGRPAARARGGS